MYFSSGRKVAQVALCTVLLTEHLRKVLADLTMFKLPESADFFLPFFCNNTVVQDVACLYRSQADYTHTNETSHKLS